MCCNDNNNNACLSCELTLEVFTSGSTNSGSGQNISPRPLFYPGADGSRLLRHPGVVANRRLADGSREQSNRSRCLWCAK